MAGQTLPSFENTTITDRRILIDNTLLQVGGDVVLNSGNTDTGSTPNYRFRPGNVICEHTTPGTWVEANDANANVGVAATISSSSHSDGNGTIRIVYWGGDLSVTTTTGTGTEANNATDLNADPEFAASFIATSGGGELTITAIGYGPQFWFYMHSDTMATAGFAEGSANAVEGTLADYRVTAAFADLQNIDGTAVTAPVPTYWSGHFDESNLVNLTPEAKQVFLSRGARFG